MKTDRALLPVLVAVTVPKYLWLLLLLVLAMMLAEVLRVLAAPVSMLGNDGLWLSFAGSFGAITCGYGVALLGYAWQRVRGRPSLRLIPGSAGLQQRIAALAIAGVAISTVLVTVLTVTDRSWRWWRAHEMSQAWLSPHFAPAYEWWAVGLSVASSLIACAVGAACRVAFPFLVASVVTLILAGRGWFWLPPLVLAIGLLWPKLTAVSPWPRKQPTSLRGFSRKDALAALMRRRAAPWVTFALPTLVLGLAMYNEGHLPGTFALTACYPLMAVSPVELRQAWLIPGVGKRGSLGDALFRVWIIDAGRIVIGALMLILLGAAVVALISAKPGQSWLVDPSAQRLFLDKARHVLVAATAIFGIVWTGLRIMTCSPRYLTSGPVNMGQGQWIPVAVALVIGFAQFALASGQWTAVDLEWLRRLEFTAVLAALVGPLFAMVFVCRNRTAWQHANLLAVAQMLDRVGRRGELGFPRFRDSSHARQS